MKSKSLYLNFLCLLVLSTFRPSVATEPCTLQVDNQLYDLRKLIKNGGEYLVDKESVKQVDGSEHEFYLNVCAKVGSTDGLQDKDHTGAFKKLATSGKNSLGRFNSTINKSGDFIALTYKDGDKCPDSSINLPMQSSILFQCDASVKDAGTPKMISSFGTCVYTFHWRTSYACPSNVSSGSSGWTTFWTIVFVVFACYLVGGILYNRFIKNERGWDQIPNRAGWAALLGGAISC
ncbi:mannose-6-phosphate receptor binding domain-containing protein [Paraphysoderma sedebokerense]|nr:mannose-6-phosphate receptor binding domain-containing protein [Paraphysoderma sedebokerense]